MPITGNRRRGAIAGAVICGIARTAVACAFLIYVGRWGGKWWSGAESAWFASLVSGLIGLPIGALAGSTCRPILGTLVGAALSGGTCLGLFVVPTNLMISMSHPSGRDGIEMTEVLIGFGVMIIAGAISGGLGAEIGRRAGTPADTSHKE